MVVIVFEQINSYTVINTVVNNKEHLTRLTICVIKLTLCALVFNQ